MVDCTYGCQLSMTFGWEVALICTDYPITHLHGKKVCMCVGAPTCTNYTTQLPRLIKLPGRDLDYV